MGEEGFRRRTLIQLNHTTLSAGMIYYAHTLLVLWFVTELLLCNKYDWCDAAGTTCCFSVDGGVSLMSFLYAYGVIVGDRFMTLKSGSDGNSGNINKLHLTKRYVTQALKLTELAWMAVWAERKINIPQTHNKHSSYQEFRILPDV